MHTKLVTTMAAAVVLAGCGRPEAPAGRTASSSPPQDTAPTSVPAAHDMSGMQDSTMSAMPGMSHAAAGDSGHTGMQMPATSAGSGASMGEMNHSAMEGMGHGAAGGGSRSGGGMAGMDHSKMLGMSHGAGARTNPDHQRMAGMDHSGMAGMSRPSAAGRTAAGMGGMSHEGMGGMSGGAARAGGEHAGMQGMDHSAAPAGAAHQAHAATSGDMGAMNHAGMQPGMSMEAGPAHAAADPGTAKLLELGEALVRDTAVQRRIREDPALRTRWSDPDVRRVIEGRP
ncbi:MAG TPA: hypothetical protein VGO40_13925 [Longimicrobium sp.]|jgi:hypothetical protein|nr:hypothetical protein [Longimicrobium sp.]